MSSRKKENNGFNGGKLMKKKMICRRERQQEKTYLSKININTDHGSHFKNENMLRITRKIFKQGHV